jgi:hypothetical protein
MRKTKVYGWNGYRSECPPALNGSCQTREICATTSIKRLCEILGCMKSELLCLSETSNTQECRLAMAAPGAVFWRPNSILGTPTDEHWTRVAGR